MRLFVVAFVLASGCVVPLPEPRTTVHFDPPPKATLTVRDAQGGFQCDAPCEIVLEEHPGAYVELDAPYFKATIPSPREHGGRLDGTLRGPSYGAPILIGLLGGVMIGSGVAAATSTSKDCSGIFDGTCRESHPLAALGETLIVTGSLLAMSALVWAFVKYSGPPEVALVPVKR
jgi:hypothetical protein